MWSSMLSLTVSDLKRETKSILEVASQVGSKLFSKAISCVWDMGEILVHTKKLQKARDWQEWSKAASILDAVEGKDEWKRREQSTLYDYRLLRRRLKLLQNIRENGDINELVHNLRSGLLRGIGGSLNPGLYEKCLVDTKHLITEYQEEVCKSLSHVLQSPRYPLKNKISFFSESRYAYGKSALLLSGGATLGMYHLGVVKALFDQDLLPRIISGTSAGALVAAIVCKTERAELATLFKKGGINCQAFENLERGSWIRKIKRFFNDGHLMDIKVFENFVRANIGELTFQEAYDKTGMILNISVGESTGFHSYRLLNYLTAPHVLIWSAAVASFAIPLVFSAVELMCKNSRGETVPFFPSGLKFIDGSVKAALPMEKLAELFNVNAFIVSQTNPWVLPLLSEEDGGGTWGDSLRYRIYKRIKRLCLMEFRHRVTQLNFLGLCDFLTNFLGILAQEYRGHVTIWPVPSLKELLGTFANPTQADILRGIKKGALRTFPKMNMLRSILAVEKEFDRCYQEIREQLQVDTFRLKVELNSQVEDVDMSISQLRPGSNLMPELKDLLEQECQLSDDD